MNQRVVVLSLLAWTFSSCAQGVQPSCESCNRVIEMKSQGVVSARGLAFKPPAAARKEFSRGVKALLNGRADDALAHLSEAIRLDPMYMEAQADLGVAYASSGHPAQALDHFEQALALEPNFHVLYENKADTLMTLGRPEEAELTARQAIRLAPLSIDANYILGMALITLGRATPEALACLKLAALKDARARRALAAVEDHVRAADR
jgi:tetratricopeptide (TPR) repeat protein